MFRYLRCLPLQQAKQQTVEHWGYGLLSVVLTFAVYFAALSIGPAFGITFDSQLKLVLVGAGVFPAFIVLAVSRKRIEGEPTKIVRAEVGPLSLLYVGIASAGFVAAISTVLSEGTMATSPLVIPASRFLLLTSFLATAIPFYHGALTYLQRANVNSKNAIVDFLFLLVEAYIILILSTSTSSANLFVNWLSVLIGIDVIWLLLTHGRKADRPPRVWLWLNVSMFLFLIMVGVFFNLVSESVDFLLLLSLVSTGRSAVDYVVAWFIYFPEYS